MITYPSTHGVFEEGIRELCAIVHRHGGLIRGEGAVGQGATFTFTLGRPAHDSPTPDPLDTP